VQGDIAECEAIAEVFGRSTPTSSLKGHLGHAMAASGTLELAACIEMLRQGVLIPTLNLENIDPLCANIEHVQGITSRPLEMVVKNNFALGGVNSSIILRRYQQ
jgi:3-oxoacyl-[acyl-carrier-protein] synthase II